MNITFNSIKSIITIQILSILFTIAGCYPSKKADATSHTYIDSIQGTWGLTNYFDTILINKELAKYRTQRPTWSAFILEIKDDSLTAYGSIETQNFKTNNKRDTISILSSGIGGDVWDLIKKDTLLTLSLKSTMSKSPELTVYTYRKRDDLKMIVDGLDSSITNYFSCQLFRGSFINLETKDTVQFLPGQTVKGLEKMSSFSVRNYFGTSHPHKNLDVVYFRNSTNSRGKQYNWLYSGDTLILTDFEQEMISYNGKQIVTDHFVLGREKIKLIKID